MAADAEKELGELEPMPVIIPKKQPAQAQAEEEEGEEVAVKPKRQMMAA